MVPVRPFHSYIGAGGIVQENLTYTVVPVANANIKLGLELVAMRQRVAFFGSNRSWLQPRDECRRVRSWSDVFLAIDSIERNGRCWTR